MSEPWGEPVLLEARSLLETAIPRWQRAGRRIVLYPAGSHTRGLFANPAFRQLNILAIADQNPALHDQTLEGLPIVAPADLPALGPDLVLVSSPPHHHKILEAFQSRWEKAGIEVVDLCAGAKGHSPLFPLALKHGLQLDDTQPETFRITRPGTPAKTILQEATPWECALDPIQNFDSYFDSVEPTEILPGELRVDFRAPAYHTLKASGLRFFFPTHAEPEADTECYLDFANLRPGSRVVDLGAFAGVSTFLLSRAVGPEGRVLAVEPDWRSLDALRRNITDHGLGNVTLQEGAVWIWDGEAAFQTEGGMSSSLVQVIGRDNRSHAVPTFTLETLLRRHGMDSVDFIKMDIEGAEREVLPQALPLLQQLRPRLVVEAHPKNGVSSVPLLTGMLREAGWDLEVRGLGLTEFPLILAQRRR